MTTSVSGFATLEDFCAERPPTWLRDGEPALDIDVLKREAHHLLGINDEPGGCKPGAEESYYRLITTWHGAHVTITTMRASVCEKVVVLETEREEEVPDPELVAAVPLVKVKVTDQITEWQCNARLAAATAPKHIRTVQVVP